jgi:hypothetical protein
MKIKNIIGSFCILSIVLIIFFPNILRKSPSFYHVPNEYQSFPSDANFEFEKISKIDIDYFSKKYDIDMKALLMSISKGKSGIVETENFFKHTTVVAVSVFDTKNIEDVKYVNHINDIYIYQTYIYLHVSVYVSYPFSFFDKKEEYLLKIGKSKIFTKISPREYKAVIPHLDSIEEK